MGNLVPSGKTSEILARLTAKYSSPYKKTDTGLFSKKVSTSSHNASDVVYPFSDKNSKRDKNFSIDSQVINPTRKGSIPQFNGIPFSQAKKNSVVTVYQGKKPGQIFGESKHMSLIGKESMSLKGTNVGVEFLKNLSSGTQKKSFHVPLIESESKYSGAKRICSPSTELVDVSQNNSSIKMQKSLFNANTTTNSPRELRKHIKMEAGNMKQNVGGQPAFQKKIKFVGHTNSMQFKDKKSSGLNITKKQNSFKKESLGSYLRKNLSIRPTSETSDIYCKRTGQTPVNSSSNNQTLVTNQNKSTDQTRIRLDHNKKKKNGARPFSISPIENAFPLDNPHLEHEDIREAKRIGSLFICKEGSNARKFAQSGSNSQDNSIELKLQQPINIDIGHIKKAVINIKIESTKNTNREGK